MTPPKLKIQVSNIPQRWNTSPHCSCSEYQCSKTETGHVQKQDQQGVARMNFANNHGNDKTADENHSKSNMYKNLDCNKAQTGLRTDMCAGLSV